METFKKAQKEKACKTGIKFKNSGDLQAIL